MRMSGPQIGVLCCIIPMPRKENVILNFVSSVETLLLRKLYVHIVIIIRALHICYVMCIKCLSDSSSREMGLDGWHAWPCEATQMKCSIGHFNSITHLHSHSYTLKPYNQPKYSHIYAYTSHFKTHPIHNQVHTHILTL